MGVGTNRKYFTFRLVGTPHVRLASVTRPGPPSRAAAGVADGCGEARYGKGPGRRVVVVVPGLKKSGSVVVVVVSGATARGADGFSS